MAWLYCIFSNLHYLPPLPLHDRTASWIWIQVSLYHEQYVERKGIVFSNTSDVLVYSCYTLHTGASVWMIVTPVPTVSVSVNVRRV